MRGRLFLELAAWLSLLLGAYGVLGVASLWGIAGGALSAVLGALVSGAVLTDEATGRARRVAKIALVLSALALAAAAAIVLVFLVSEL